MLLYIVLIEPPAYFETSRDFVDKYDYSINYMCRLNRAQCVCVIPFWLKSTSTWFQVTRPLDAFVLVTYLYLGKCNQPRLITVTSTLIIPDITKTSSNYCLLSEVNFSPAGTYVQKCRLMRFNPLYE